MCQLLSRACLSSQQASLSFNGEGNAEAHNFIVVYESRDHV